MLLRVLEEIEAAGGSITFEGLGQRLDMDAAVLADMLDFLIRKGKLERATWMEGCITAAETPPPCPACPLHSLCYRPTPKSPDRSH